MRNASGRNAGVWLITASLALAPTLARAQEAGSRQTREFVQAAASSDQFEVLAAQTALTQSTNVEVRAFAARMLQDHQRLIEATREATARSGLKLPQMAMSADQAQWLGALQSVSGNEFDTLYLRQQMLAHSSALAFEQIYAKSGDDPNMRQFAASTVPLMAAHAEMANQTAMKLGSQ